MLLNVINLGGVAYIYFSKWLISNVFLVLEGGQWLMAIYLSFCLISFYSITVFTSMKNLNEFERMYAAFPEVSKE